MKNKKAAKTSSVSAALNETEGTTSTLHAPKHHKNPKKQYL